MNDSMSNGRLRISLKTMLFSVAIIAIVLTVWQQTAELGPLRREVRELRDETGQLTIEDAEKIHAIQMATDYPLAWKWRVYIPSGRKILLRHHVDQITKEGLPQNSGYLTLVGPKEVIVTVKLDQQPDGRWRCGITSDGATSYEPFPEEASRWLKKGKSGSLTHQVGRTVAVERAGEPLVLLRQRVFYEKGTIPPRIEPAETDGILVWLDE